MKLRKLTEDCPNRTCPTVYLSDRDTVVFQGNVVVEVEGLQLGAGEQAVELPLEIVRQALPGLAEGR